MKYLKTLITVFILFILTGCGQPTNLSGKYQGAKAKQSEAQKYVGAMNRVQQAFYLEKSKFATTIEELGVVIKSETQNYRYQIIPQADGKSVMITGTAKTPDLKNYAGLVFIVKDTKTADSITVPILCEAQQSSTPPIMPTAPTDSSQTIPCPSGWSQVR